MGYFLGIDLGASRTVAAVARAAHDGAETVDLGDGEGEGVASALHLGADGTLAVGAAARGWELTEPDRVVEGFPGRIGDDDPMLLAGEPWAPEELTAWLVRWVVDRVAQREGSAAEAVAVARPASWDDARTALLTAAVAEQDLAVSLIAPEVPEPADATDDAADPQVGAACAVAVALRDAAGGQPAATTASGRHAVVGGAIAALAGVPAAEESESRDDDGPAVEEPADVVDEGPVSESLFDEGPRRPDVEAGHGADPDGDAEQDHGPADTGGSPAATGSWDMPAPRVHASGAYDPAVSDGGRPADPETGGTGGGADPATTNLVAELLGFTGGMGATNTAGLLSGYTPPQGMPAAWSGGPVAIAPAETGTRTGTATGRAVALPRQRASSGRWSAVAPAPDELRAPAPALRARNNPTVLVGAGGLVAAVAVVGTLFLWPAPRVTNSATSRPIPVAPVATAPAEPTAAATVVLTPEPTPVPRARPAPPRTRRPAVPPPLIAPESASVTASPAGSAEPTEPTSTLPPSTDVTAPPTTKSDDD